MSTTTPGPLGTPRPRSRLRREADGQPTDRPPLRPPVRALDDGTTERVRVIEFVLPAGTSIQPVLWLDRQLLD
ncbi:MAG TPA: hypothetical protein VHK05_08440 [Candidatus Limnocylindrales bacterium]|nr:hypothetical protein [Candidatus Limnocylindrales bacterium]